MGPVDPNTRHRIIRSALTALDEDWARPGYTRYSPHSAIGQVYLIDLQGVEVHRWDLPYPPGLYGYLLPNGNTLITEGMFGRMFPVTPNGEVVWEYVNPRFHTSPNGAEVNQVFRATHYMAQEIPALG